MRCVGGEKLKLNLPRNVELADQTNFLNAVHHELREAPETTCNVKFTADILNVDLMFMTSHANHLAHNGNEGDVDHVEEHLRRLEGARLPLVVGYLADVVHLVCNPRCSDQIHHSVVSMS